ncbi:MAG: hypothetical protein ABI425_01725 [Patescibacteria group bacterium]
MIQTVDIHDTENDTVEMTSSNVTESSTVNIQSKRNTDMKPKTPVIVVILLVAIVSGLATGTGIHALNQKGGSLLGSNESGSIKEQTPSSSIKVGDVYGSPKEDTFKDSAEGVLQAGGIDGEGTHKLVRAGGISQTVYLTSAVTDLDKFIGAKVKVWGETNTAQKAGWLMDVGRIKVEELNAEIPEESKPTSTSAPKPSATPKSSSKKAAPTTDGE